MSQNILIILNIFMCVLCPNIYSTQTCSRGEDTLSKFLLYDINPGEGFNLRRDVYLRMTNLVRKLNDIEKWTLVLPPWGNLYHWGIQHKSKYFLWKDFFDVESLNRWVPVIEMKQYIETYKNEIDQVFFLQHYSEGWGDTFEDKFDVRPCIEHHRYIRTNEKFFTSHIWNESLKFSNISCISIQGSASVAIPLITGNKSIRSVMVDHAEILLHDDYGERKYWSARRSMRFSKILVEEANKYRKLYLNSTNTLDKTIIPSNWRDQKPKKGTALGGPYLSVHLRRRDFLRARPDEVPSLSDAARQINTLIKKWNLSIIFVASDAPPKEISELNRHLGLNVFTYSPPSNLLDKYGPGAAAIIDQIISSHGRAFVGSFESTFSFRIQEEREILGFSPNSTFNRLCGTNPSCDQPSRWLITY